VQELLAQITWYHHIAILDKVKDPAEREWYIHETIRSLRCRNRIASSAGGSMGSSEPVRQSLRRNSGTGCRRMQKTERQSASSRAGRNSKTRYATSGLQHEANLDDSNMWPAAFALKKVTAAQRGNDRSAREESGELKTMHL